MAERTATLGISVLTKEQWFHHFLDVSQRWTVELWWTLGMKSIFTLGCHAIPAAHSQWSHPKKLTPLCLTYCPLRDLPPCSICPAGGHTVKFPPGQGIFINHKLPVCVSVCVCECVCCKKTEEWQEVDVWGLRLIWLNFYSLFLGTGSMRCTLT